MADNRKYYYLKLKENFFDSDSIVLLEDMKDGILYSNILLKLYLKSLKNGGKLQLDEHIPYTAQMIATLTRHQIGTVEILYNFMNTETYDQVALTKEQVGDSLKFVKENEVVKVCSWNGNVYAIEPPLFVELEVIETEPGFAGNTAQGATKPATVETGAQVMVPLFVNQGDKLKIDTRTGEYLSRV